MKRTLAILLAVLLLIGALPISASAADSDTADTGDNLITSIAVTVASPICGSGPSYEVAVPDGKGYHLNTTTYGFGAYVRGIEWHKGGVENISDERYIMRPDTDLFEEGEQYSVKLKLSTDDGYAFAPSGSFTAAVNGNEAKITSGDDHDVFIACTFTAEAYTEEIGEVDVTVYPPVGGFRPAYEAFTPEGAPYQVDTDYTFGSAVVNGVAWYDDSDAMKPTDVFEAGKTYTARVFLKPVSDTYFFADQVNVLFNGGDGYEYNREYIQANGNTKDDIAVEKLIRAKEPVEISNIIIGGFKAPMAGGLPVTAEEMFVGDPAYRISNIIWKVKNDDGAFVTMDANKRFEAGNDYQLKINLISDYHNGYLFARDERGTINSFDSITINGEEELVDQRSCYVLSDCRQFGVYTTVMTAENPRGTTGDCEWEYDAEGETLYITGSGYMGDYSDYDFDGVEVPVNTPWKDYKDTMRCVVIGQGVKNVGKFAFDGCSKLETAVIGTDVETVGTGAFRDCALTEIDLSQSVSSIGSEAFCGCGALSSVKLSHFIDMIGEKAFYGTSLRQITIPNSDVIFGYRSLGYDANDRVVSGFTVYGYTGSTAETYADDNGFTFVEIGGVTGDCWWTFDDDTNTLTIGGNGAMEDGNGAEMMPWTHFVANDNDPWHLVFEGNITHIGAFAFERLPLEGGADIPYTCTSIGENAFIGCKGLSTASLDNVQVFGDGAFCGCSGLTTVSVQAARTIGDSAFKDCSNVSTVMFGSALVTIGDSAFEGCYALDSVDIPKNVESIGDSAFNDCRLSSLSFRDDSKLKVIGARAFIDCDLMNLDVPDSVTVIRDYAFANNQNLEYVTLSKGLEAVGDGAFRNTGISNITIHGAVNEIGEYAFGYQSGPGGDGFVPVDSLTIRGLTGSAAEDYAATEEHFHFIANDSNEGRTGDCTWYYDDTDYTLWICGSGSTADYNNPDDAPWYWKHENIGDVKIGENVTRIGKNAFNDIMGIFVPENVDTIVDGAIGFDFNEEPIEGYRLYGYAGSAAEEYADKYDHIRFKDVTVNPDSGYTGGRNIYWSFNSNTGTLTIERENESWEATIDDFDFAANAPWGGQGSKAPWAYLGDKVSTIEIKDGIKSIGAYAFAFLSKAMWCNIGESVEKIEEGAFYGVPIGGVRIYHPECIIEDCAFGYGDDPDTGTSYTPFEMTVAGYKGSTAEQYADNNESIDFYDLNTRYLYDGETFVTVITTQPDVELVVEKVDEANFVVVIDGVVYYEYDISLQKDGETVQPDEPVTVRLPLIGEYDENIKVYRVEADGSLTDMNAEYFDGDLMFTTDHFSLYVVVHEEPIPDVPLLLGDVDGDGEVTVMDVTAIQRVLAKIPVASYNEAAADVTGDGEIAIDDVTYIQRWLAKMTLPENVHVNVPIE